MPQPIQESPRKISGGKTPRLKHQKAPPQDVWLAIFAEKEKCGAIEQILSAADAPVSDINVVITEEHERRHHKQIYHVN